jgi:DNA-directed RNA polymerase specialized sigma subunit
LSQRLAWTPQPSEIATLLELDVGTVFEALQTQHAGRMFSIDELTSDDHCGGRRRFSSHLGTRTGTWSWPSTG